MPSFYLESMLGDGSCHRQGAEKRPADPVRTFRELPAHGKNPEKAADMAVRLLFPYRKNVLTITTDNGSEFACHEKVARRLGTTVYFAGSYASWQKGAVENANKLVRQYMPKGTGFREISDEFVRQIQYKINRRPREKLNFSSPKKKFFNLIA